MFIFLPEVGDGDDEHQVVRHSEQRDAGNQDVNEYILSSMLRWLLQEVLVSSGKQSSAASRVSIVRSRKTGAVKLW